MNQMFRPEVLGLRRAAAVLPVVVTGLVACGTDNGTGPDTTPPSVPAAIQAVVISVTRIDVSWKRAADNVAVTGYRVYRNGTFRRAVTDTSTSDTGLTPGILYCYAVSARDAAGNESAQGTPSCAATANAAPVAVLDAPEGVLTGQTATFDARASHDADGTITSYRFDFADGTPVVVQATPTATHAYAVSGTYLVSLTVTDDFGATGSTTREITSGLVVSPPVNISHNPVLSQTPFFARDDAGAINVVWEERGDDIVFSRSTDGGRTFAQPKYVVAPSDPFGADNGYSSGQMQVASTTDGAIHVAWTIFDLLFGGAEIFYSRSNNGGTTFSAPLMVSSNDGVNSYIPSVAADGASTIGISWGDSNLDTGASAVWYSASVDGGGTFSAPVLVAASGGCPSVAVTGANVYIAWTAGPFGQEQILFARSSDGGATFSSPSVVDHFPDKSWCPHLRVDRAGAIYVMWEEGPAFQTNVLFSRSTDGGASFSAPTTVAPLAGCSGVAPGIGGSVYISWVAGGRSFLATSTDGGMTFATPLKVPGLSADASCIQVIAAPQNEIGLGWFGVPAGQQYADIFYAGAQVSVP